MKPKLSGELHRKLETNFAGITLKNPLVLASGTCGFGREFSELFAVNCLGGICSKGLTLNPKPGNEGIRIWETAAGVMNSVGLENPGVAAFIEGELPFMQSLGKRAGDPRPGVLGPEVRR